jgi:hypothetical protein
MTEPKYYTTYTQLAEACRAQGYGVTRQRLQQLFEAGLIRPHGVDGTGRPVWTKGDVERIVSERSGKKKS